MITEQWEYMQIKQGASDSVFTERLADAGKDGWEAFAVTGDTAKQSAHIWLKRRIPLSPAVRKMMAKGIV